MSVIYTRYPRTPSGMGGWYRGHSVTAVVLVVTQLVTLLSVTDGRVGQVGRSRRVIGGTEVTEGQWPSLVNLRGHIPTSRWWVFDTSYIEYSCSGSLIGKRWVLSAAHCFSTIKPLRELDSPLKWRVKAGDISRKPGSLFDVIKSAFRGDVSQDSGRKWYVRVSKIIIHPQYQPSDTFSWKYDLALIKLARDLPLAPDNPLIDTATLPTTLNVSWPPPGANCSLQGWGCTVKDGTPATIARMIQLPVLAADDCAKEFGDLEDNRICAGYNGGGKGLCKGDSGGPLFCLDGNTWKQAGITSYTSASSPADVPGVFTRVTKFLDWILTTMAAN